MSAVNTDEGTILEVLNDKLDRDANNLDTSTTNFDVVVDYQVPTAENDYTWYRKYASGWEEQGVIALSFTTTTQTFTLPVEMATLDYTVCTSHRVENNNYAYAYSYTTTTVRYRAAAGSAQNNGITVSGMAA